MKAFTDISQSKKLAEILPLESADMFWLVLGNTPRVHVLTEPLSNYSQWESYPCWSLAVLISVLPDTINGTYCRLTIDKGGDVYNISYEDFLSKKILILYTEYSLIDACYKMIIKLKEKRLL